jgi:hypothetical protein
MLTVYHRTTHDAAEHILHSGFRDGTDYYMTPRKHSGVWVSDQPLDINEGADGDALLRIRIAEELIAKRE